MLYSTNQKDREEWISIDRGLTHMTYNQEEYAIGAPMKRERKMVWIQKTSAMLLALFVLAGGTCGRKLIDWHNYISFQSRGGQLKEIAVSTTGSSRNAVRAGVDYVSISLDKIFLRNLPGVFGTRLVLLMTFKGVGDKPIKYPFGPIDVDEHGYVTVDGLEVLSPFLYRGDTISITLEMHIIPKNKLKEMNVLLSEVKSTAAKINVAAVKVIDFASGMFSKVANLLHRKYVWRYRFSLVSQEQTRPDKDEMYFAGTRYVIAAIPPAFVKEPRLKNINALSIKQQLKFQGNRLTWKNDREYLDTPYIILNVRRLAGTSRSTSKMTKALNDIKVDIVAGNHEEARKKLRAFEAEIYRNAVMTEHQKQLMMLWRRYYSMEIKVRKNKEQQKDKAELGARNRQVRILKRMLRRFGPRSKERILGSAAMSKIDWLLEENGEAVQKLEGKLGIKRKRAPSGSLRRRATEPALPLLPNPRRRHATGIPTATASLMADRVRADMMKGKSFFTDYTRTLDKAYVQGMEKLIQRFDQQNIHARIVYVKRNWFPNIKGFAESMYHRKREELVIVADWTGIVAQSGSISRRNMKTLLLGYSDIFFSNRGKGLYQISRAIWNQMFTNLSSGRTAHPYRPTWKSPPLKPNSDPPFCQRLCRYTCQLSMRFAGRYAKYVNEASCVAKCLSMRRGMRSSDRACSTALLRAKSPRWIADHRRKVEQRLSQALVAARRLSIDQLRRKLQAIQQVAAMGDHRGVNALFEKMLARRYDFETVWGRRLGTRIWRSYRPVMAQSIRNGLWWAAFKRSLGRQILITDFVPGQDLSQATIGQRKTIRMMVSPTTLYAVRFVKPGYPYMVRMKNFIHVNDRWIYIGKISGALR